MLSNQEIDDWFRFFGYGDPNSRVWFVGIEEGGCPYRPNTDHWQFISEVDAYIVPELPKKEGSKDSRVWATCAAIATACNLESRYFLSNMAPVPRPRESNFIAGLDGATYRTRVIRDRIPNLYKLASYFKPAAIIFHGKGAWFKYRVTQAFSLCAPEQRNGSRVLTYPDRGIAVCNTFAWGRRHFSEHDQRMVEVFTRNCLELSQAT